MKYGTLLTPPVTPAPLRLGLMFALLLAVLVAFPATAQQRPPEVCSPTNCLPPVDKRYKGNQNQKFHQKYGSGVGEVKKGYHKRFTTWGVPPEPGLPAIPHRFRSKLGGVLVLGGATNEFEFDSQVTVMVQFDHLEGATSVYKTEMTELAVTSSAPALIIRESPTLASSGETTIRPVPGGYAISSFFDVFTELSLDGGSTWLPSRDDMGAPFAGRMELTDDDGPPLLTTAADVAPIPDQPYCQPPGTNWPIKFGQQVQARNFKHRNLQNPARLPPLGLDQIYTANGTIIEADFSLDGGQTFQRANALANVAVRAQHTVDANDGHSRFFDTEILSLNISGGSLPPGVLLRESPTLHSLGEHVVRGSPGEGNSRISSYFYVNLELSLDGGANWVPASGPVRVELPGTIGTIPTLSEWGLILLALLLLTVGTVYLVRRQPALALAGAAGAVSSDRPLFWPALLVRVLTATLLVTALGAASIVLLGGRIGPTDVVGTTLSAVIVAYWIHLLIGSRKGSIGND